ncbi:peptidase M42 family protein [Natrialba hulunbeirensis JCM 10989]|uniref:Peptidase M42 family protein n=1 Tax=Natrialba hulunbeirensis JCM 10989 TaxID=1227493 RepID=M0A1T9_9EURY|nr:M20/M25/M40 family metallo-hydrolase [Natrialba hulunbeirensis]ELY92291.1 peptidase M42 family protein [Natrialba hulunbeirensis JCM 10989]
MALKRTELDRLVAARGGPGGEYHVARVFEELIDPYVDEVSWDAMGNVVATSYGEEGGTDTGDGDADATDTNETNGDTKDVLLAAHTDELAFLIDGITEDGLCSFSMLGGHYRGYLPGQHVLVGPDNVPGVVGTKPRHFMDSDEKDSLPETLHIDLGAQNPAEVAELNVEPGDHATWDRELTDLANGRLAGRALDDRIALAILVAVARETESDRTVHYAATVQEEVGLRGARAAVHEVDPDIAIALEIFPSDDYPIDGDRSSTVELGGGPVVEFGDGTSEYLFGGVLVDRQTLEWLTAAGSSADVALQHDVMIGGTTDATEFQSAGRARHAGAIAVPCRYTHSPVETIDLDDAEETVDVLVAALESSFPGRTDVRGRRSQRET